MKKLLIFPVLAMTCLTAWKAPTLASIPTASASVAPETLAASGTFVQTGITSLEMRAMPGGGVILYQTSNGTVSGTLSGSYTDSLIVVIQPNGRFAASFTLDVECTLDGVQGVLSMQAADVGTLTGPTTAAFSGVAAITGASGGLAGTTGVLDIAGTVDLVSGLSTYSYEGELRTGE